MLTVNINDTHLEKRIIEKARLKGKSAQEIIKDLLANALPETNEDLQYQKLNPKDYGYFINNTDENIADDNNIKLFSQVDDPKEFTETLRKKGWRKQ